MSTQANPLQDVPRAVPASHDRDGRGTGSWVVRFRRHAPEAGGFGTTAPGAAALAPGVVVGGADDVPGAERLVVAGRVGSLTLRLAGDVEPPSTASDGRVGAVVWGDVYFQDELRRVLGLERDAGRAAIAVAAYRRWGEALPSRVVGRCAIVLYDAQEDLLMAARD